MYSTRIIFKLAFFCGITILFVGIYLKISNQISSSYYQYRRIGIDYKTEIIDGNGTIILGLILLAFSYFGYSKYKSQKEYNQTLRKEENEIILSNRIRKEKSIIKLLVLDLKKAEKILMEYSGGYSGEYLSAEEFLKDLTKNIAELESGNTNVINDLWIWFAPTCQWDDFVGNVELGEKIFKQLNYLKNKASR